MKKIMALSLCLFFLSKLFAQNTGTGTAIIHVNPPDAMVRVDGKMVSDQRGQTPTFQNVEYKVELSPGEHLVEAWIAPMQTLKKTISIKAGDSLHVSLGVKEFDPEFVHYRKGVTNYFTKKALRYGSVVGVVGIATFYWTSIYSTDKLNDYKSRTLGYGNAYKSAIVESIFEENKVKFEEFNNLYKEEIKAVEQKRKIGIGVSALVTGATALLIRHYIRNPLIRPEYHQKAPFSMTPNVQFDGQNIGLGLGFTF